MKTPLPTRGIYVITDGRPAGMLERVEEALCGGAAMVQYRDLTGDDSRRAEEARTLAGLCRRHGVPLVIDHDVALAAAVDADGVHLSQADGAPARVRAALGPDAIVGVSCYASAALASTAAAAGASYVSLGAFHPSPTKPGAGHAPIELLHETRHLGIPRVAIGGISLDNGGSLVAAGAEFLATVSAVFGTGDPRTATAQLAALFQA
ncbi:MAG: thiamine phosphate synthase [Xanthomonadaceae bacterium]|nr:thiamine phosphate synthase [Xanthomonadaceae bacterium]MDE1965388.1 thiamine phosphate synthase [Xanthomonadaceae bacterium]